MQIFKSSFRPAVAIFGLLFFLSPCFAGSLPGIDSGAPVKYRSVDSQGRLTIWYDGIITIDGPRMIVKNRHTGNVVSVFDEGEGFTFKEASYQTKSRDMTPVVITVAACVGSYFVADAYVREQEDLQNQRFQECLDSPSYEMGLDCLALYPPYNGDTIMSVWGGVSAVLTALIWKTSESTTLHQYLRVTGAVEGRRSLHVKIERRDQSQSPGKHHKPSNRFSLIPHKGKIGMGIEIKF